MVGTYYGDQSRVVLCEAVTAGTQHTTKAADSGSIVYIKCAEPEIGVSFDSKIKNQSFGKSRLTPDVKYKQSFNCSDGIILSHNVPDVKKWLMDRYIAKAGIYLLVAVPLSTGTPEAYPDGTGTNIHLVGWYNASQTEVFYLKGHLGNVKFKITKGRVYHISFDFKECWA